MRPITLAFLATLPVAGVVFACSDSEDSKPNDATTQGSPEELFRAVQGDLVKTCGGTAGGCHVEGTYKNAQGSFAAKWLGPGDPYAVAKAYPGIVPLTNDPKDSKLLTQIEHDGPALVSFPELFEGVRKWVTAEVVQSGATRPVTDAFLVKEGANSVSLAKLAAGAEGAVLTFDAQTLDTTVFLSNMKITAGARSLSLNTATFVVLPASGPTRIDALSGFHGELRVKAGETLPFFSGETILQKWNALNRLKIVFDQFGVADATPDASIGGGCKSVDSFVSNAVPAFNIDLGGGRTCLSCHAATNPTPGSPEDVAVSTLDLRAVTTDPATACAQALAHINRANKPNSNLVNTPVGAPNGDPTHPVRRLCSTPDGDGGLPLCVPDTYATGVMAWISAE